MAAVQPTGWIKPERVLTCGEIEERIAQLRAELNDLERQAADMRETARLEALARIRNIMRAQQLSIDDIVAGGLVHPGRRQKGRALSS